jgi:hypothetical protein
VKTWWRKWSYEIPLAVGDALWEVLVVRFAAFLDRLTVRKVIEFIAISLSASRRNRLRERWTVAYPAILARFPIIPTTAADPARHEARSRRPDNSRDSGPPYRDPPAIERPALPGTR